jgi:tetratricopeptide (TPR) repeat protein
MKLKMKNFFLISAVALLWLLLFSVDSQAKENWKSIESAHFLVVGNASEADIKRVTTQLEQFRHILSVRLPNTKISSSASTVVVLFNNEGSFHPFKPRHKGKIKDNVAGYFSRDTDKNYIVLPVRNDGVNPLEVIFHEYLHFIINNNFSNAPAWMNEGLAEFYSTFKTIESEKKYLLGDPVAHHLVYLRAKKLMPMETLLRVDRKSPHYNESDKAGLFYAQSWALVHYLILGDGGKRQTQLSRFINKLNSGKSLEENFRESFQTDYKTMEKELGDYIKRYSMPAIKGDFSKYRNDNSEMQVSSLPDSAAFYYMGDLFLRLNAHKEAEENLQKAIKLDAGSASSYISLGMLRMKQKQEAEALNSFKTAISIDPKNPLAHYKYAEALAEERRYDVAIESYKQAIRLKPDLPNIHSDLGFAYLDAGRDEEANESFNQAIRINSGDPLFYRIRAYAYLRRARGDLAASDAMTYINRQGWQEEHSLYMALAAYFGYRQARLSTEADKVLSEAAARSDASDWAYSILRYLQRAITEKELLAKANDNDKQTEAHAYIGMDLALNGNREAAHIHLQWVKEKGNKNFVEFRLVLAELNRLETAAGYSRQ